MTRARCWCLRLPGFEHAQSAALLALAAAAGLVAATGAGATDRVERRLACQEEARRHVRAPRPADLELYRRMVHRRQVYIQDCMLNGTRDAERTGTVGAPPPAEPRRDGQDVRPGGRRRLPS